MSWFFLSNEDTKCKNCGIKINSGNFCNNKCKKEYVKGSIIRDIIVLFFLRK